MYAGKFDSAASYTFVDLKHKYNISFDTGSTVDPVGDVFKE